MLRGRCYPLTILDNHSRFAVGVHALSCRSTELIQAALVTTFERYGLPEMMLLDHGNPW